MIGRDTFSVLAPVLGPLTKKMAMSPSSTVHGGQHDTQYVTFELQIHAAFVTDEIWGFMLEPARSKHDNSNPCLGNVKAYSFCDRFEAWVSMKTAKYLTHTLEPARVS